MVFMRVVHTCDVTEHAWVTDAFCLSGTIHDPSRPRATFVPLASTAAQQAAVAASDLQLAAHWWHANESKHPTLFCMWRNYAQFQTTMVLVERGFSVMRDRVRDKRSNLASESVNAEMCLLDWLRGQSQVGHPLHGVDNNRLVNSKKVE